MAQQFEITYLDKTTATVEVTLFDTVQAEKYLRAHDMGTLQDSPIRAMSYMCYMNLRRNNKVEGQDFETWLQTVQDVQVISEDTDPLG